MRLVVFAAWISKHHGFSMAAHCNKNLPTVGDHKHRLRYVRTSLLAAFSWGLSGAAPSHVCNHLFGGSSGTPFPTVFSVSDIVESRDIGTLFRWIARFLLHDDPFTLMAESGK
jgi:hypothetical protein